METVAAGRRIPDTGLAMADYGWNRKGALIDWLFDEPWRFEFFQAVRILETISPAKTAPGESPDPDSEFIRFRSRVGLEFPASEIQQLTPPTREGLPPGLPPEMSVNFLGLAGLLGPLTHPDTELILERNWRKDFAFRDFLDIFNHRILAFMVANRKAHRLSLTAQAPHKSAAARYLFSFFGLGLQGLANRLRLEDRALLHYSGLLAQHPRSASGLEILLSDFYGVAIHVRQLVGTWRPLEPAQWTRIGLTGQNQALGRDTVAGTRWWDQQGAIEVTIGPMPLSLFRDLLPAGNGFTPLCELTRFYCGRDTGFTFRYTLAAAEVPEARLGSAKLGWTSWLRTVPALRDDSQVRISQVPIIARGGQS
jgi:type VI secretion system protein ImpH